MSNSKDDRVRGIIRELAGKFVSRESNRTSLVTVTDVKISDQGNRATILVTVLPEHKAPAAIDFLKRKRSEFRGYVMDESRLNRIPTFDFQIDIGEKNRQRIDELSNM